MFVELVAPSSASLIDFAKQNKAYIDFAQKKNNGYVDLVSASTITELTTSYTKTVTRLFPIDDHDADAALRGRMAVTIKCKIIIIQSDTDSPTLPRVEH
jgi:hypothetical protein